MLTILLETELFYILRSIGKFGTKQTDDPRQLQPHQQKGKHGKTTIDGIILAHPNLTRNIEILEELERTSRYKTGCQTLHQMHFRIRQRNIESRKYQGGNHIRYNMQNGLDNRCEKKVPLHKGVLNSGDENRQSAGCRHQYGQQQKKSQIIRNLSSPRTRFLDLPDFVERIFDGR